MAALIETEKMVNDYWVKKYGTIDKNSEDYNVLRSWASSKAFNARKPVTLEMLLKEVGQSKPMSTPSASASKPNPKPKPAASSMVKESLAYMYPLFGKKDGRGNVKKDDDELYKSMQAWIAEQVKVELTGKVMSQSAIKEKYAALAGQVSSGMKRTVINLSRASADAKKAKMENAAPVREIQWEERTTAELPPEILADLKKLLGHIQMVGEEAGTVLKKL